MNLTLSPAPRFGAVLRKAPTDNTPASKFSVRGQEYFATAEAKTALDDAVKTVEYSKGGMQLDVCRKPNYYLQEDPAITLALLKRELSAKAQ